MTKRVAARALLLSTLWVLGLTVHSHAGWSVGVRLNVPAYRYRPYYRYCPPYYRYRPYYYHPIYVRPRPVVVREVEVPVYPAPRPVYQQPPVAPPPTPVPTPAPVTTPIATTSIATTRAADVQAYLKQLQHHDERERAEAAIQLGRLRALSAVPTLQATLSNDRSARARESAARALGLIGSPDSLASLDRAAKTDVIPAVRQSASFSAEVIRTRR